MKDIPYNYAQCVKREYVVINEKMGNQSRDIHNIKEQMQFLKLKNTIPEIKILLVGLNKYNIWQKESTMNLHRLIKIISCKVI